MPNLTVGFLVVTAVCLGTAYATVRCPSFNNQSKLSALVEIENIEVLLGTFVGSLEQQCTGTDDSGNFDTISCVMPRFEAFCSSKAGAKEGVKVLVTNSTEMGPYCYCRMLEFANKKAIPGASYYFPIVDSTSTTAQTHTAFSNTYACQSACTRLCYNRLTQMDALFYLMYTTFMQNSV